jgi:two-component system nitrogen regulation sensor histidine kinase NtrY
MSPHEGKQRWRLAVGGILLTLLLAAVFTLGSLDVPIEPRSWREVMALYAVSSFITAALLVFGLILTRSVVRLWAERRKEQLGARFKTKMVVGAMAISLLPVVFMFFVSYALLNRTLGRWFPRPLEIASEGSASLMRDFGKMEAQRLKEWAESVAHPAPGTSAESSAQRAGAPAVAITYGVDAAWLLNPDGNITQLVRRSVPAGETSPPRFANKLPSGAEVWFLDNQPFLTGRAKVSWQNATLVVARRLPANYLDRYAEIQAQTLAYSQEKQQLRALKRQMLLILLLFTVLLLFAVMWLALFLSKQVTVPIQALAEGTREVSAGNFDYQVPE